MAFDKGLVTASGELTPDTVDFTCDIREMPVALARLTGITGFDGELAATLRVSGNPEHPEALAEVRVSDLVNEDVSFEEVPPVQVAGRAHLREDRLEIAMDASGLFEKPITSALTMPIAISLAPFAIAVPDEGVLDGRFESEAQLETLARFLLLDEHRVTGDLNVAFKIGGTFAQPALSGRAVIDGGSYDYDRTGTSLDDIAVLLVADGSRVNLERAEANDGAVSASGHLALDREAGFPFQWDVRVDRSRLVRRDDVTAEIGANLTLEGAIDAAMLAGTITVHTADIRPPERAPAMPATLEVVEVGRGTSQQHPAEAEQAPSAETAANTLERLALDMTVDIPGRAFVRAYDFDSEWGGSFRVKGTAAEPHVSGTLSAVRGRLHFLNRRFALGASSVSLDGSYPPEPTLDVALETKTRDLAALLRLSGPVSSPEIDLSSEPALPQDEILARLLFGRDLTQISPMRALELARAARILTGEGDAFDFLGRTRSTFGIDELELTQGDEEGEGMAVNVGKYLTDRIYVEMEKGLGEQADQVSIEVEVTRNITIESDVGTDSEGGVWLQWKYDY
ncbi:MAG TPA: translocation/assembly module TamB [Candidatus Hydrogenedentes bacterium]|nr:translocation/assembly module TamB [Candidatus Hydrogenedentota bacterium]